MSHYNPVLLPKVRSALIMAAAKGMPCTLRIASFMPSWRCADQSTVVMCHIPSAGKGMGTKSSDLFVAAGCAHCHAIIDGVDKRAREYITEKYPAAYAERMLRGMQETQSMLVALGLIKVQGGEIVE
jgi:hypothetical protein